jgi:hypothetical protein
MSSEKGSDTQRESTNTPPQQPVTPEPFQNDPEDPANPNKEVERFRDKLRPNPL